jgi:ectoine hydroxylase-related dioxygenase (phytanoyl-CoA dioxygenase family)
MSVLSEAEVHHFRREGWVRHSGLLGKSHVDILQEVFADAEKRSELWNAHKTEGAQAHQAEETFQRMFRNTYNLRFEYPQLNEVIKAIKPAAADLLATDDLRIWWDQVFIKPPKNEGTRVTVWHQDFPFWPLDRRGCLTFWIAVEDVQREQGTLRFVPRSHRLGPIGRLDLVGSEPPLEEVLKPDDFSYVGPVSDSVNLAAGDFSVHDALTLHGADENTSDRPRRGWGVTLFPGDTLYTGAPHVNVEGAGMAAKEEFSDPRFLLPV